jgi:hypothetical protein
MRADGRTDRHDEGNSRFVLFCECAYKQKGYFLRQIFIKQRFTTNLRTLRDPLKKKSHFSTPV